MKLYGRLVKEAKTIKEASVEKEDEKASFRDLLEDCLVNLCRELDIPVPLWLRKNSTEFVNYRKTFFPKEQFVEKVRFDRFEISLE